MPCLVAQNFPPIESIVKQHCHQITKKYYIIIVCDSDLELEVERFIKPVKRDTQGEIYHNEDLELFETLFKNYSISCSFFQYFSAKLKNKPNLESTFQNYFSVGSMGPNMFIMILNVFLFHK